MNVVNEYRCIAHECIIGIMNSDDFEKETQLNLLDEHVKTAIKKVQAEKGLEKRKMVCLSQF